MPNTIDTPIRTEPKLPLTSSLGAVHIAVTDRESALKIWRDVVGLTLIEDNAKTLSLGVDEDVLIVLELSATGPVVANSIGLYHVAIHVPNRIDLARLVMRASAAGVRVAPTDHLVTEAVYLWDADGNGIEITFETPWRGTLADPDNSEGMYGVASDGTPHSGREPIDLDDLLGELAGSTDYGVAFPTGTRIGHVHVHVTDLDIAMHFYRDVIGFGGLFILRKWGLGDVGLDYMPHIIAFNIWAGENAVLPPEGVAGLRYFTIHVPDQQTSGGIRERLLENGFALDDIEGGFETKDPFGNRLRIELKR